MAGHVLHLGLTGAAEPLKEWMLQRLAERDPGGRVVLQHAGHQPQHQTLTLALQASGAAAPVLRQGAAVLGRVAGSRQAPVPG